MNLTTEQIQTALKELDAKPIFKGSDHFILFGEVIETGKIETLQQLIQHAFAAGMMRKIREIKVVLDIIDPRN